ncbi:phosphomethylpyrimidine kinase [Pyrobaculum oguniense TE7]|uniref:Phosphomethylpyrimidine kinase n=1 Tax=Pyrobaculum oguniense (strain DSM 13380 / JCM 10595 / TE7) TaxID=698757 RepID=H6QC49_PYROT|nr:phosphomethylpyrimidine kinase [Pyrobaculum oguniense TE7]
MWRVAITIAGLDSGGGAGIHADIKTFAAMGVHGTTALTCVTAQNTYEVREAQCLAPSLVRSQIMAVWDDMGIDAGKTGMLGTREIIEEVASTVSKLGFPLVVDPVMVAKSGAPLISDDAVDVLRRRLLPVAKVVTPNRPEAERLTGMKIASEKDAERAAEYIHKEYGTEVVVVKGGHLEGAEAVDVVYYKGSFHKFSTPRLESRATHGTGCAYSAAIAAALAKGLDPLEAIKTAKRFIYTAIKYGVSRGKGHWPVNPTAWVEIPAERWRAVQELNAALDLIRRNAAVFAKAIPEVQSNIGYVIDPRYAEGPGDVAAVPGRIVNYMGEARPSGPPTFGASSHTARKILAFVKKGAEARAAMNIRYSPDLVEKAKSLGYRVAVVDRRKEPEEVKQVEGGSMAWVVGEALSQTGGAPPDIIADLGDWGKEPQITILGRSPVEVVEKALRLLT